MQGWGVILDDWGRKFYADAEDLAEGGIAQFLRSIEPFLKRQGVDGLEIEEQLSETGYTVIIGSTPYPIYTQEEMETEDGWWLATVRTFELVNELLVLAGSEERFYAVGGGNDMFGLFLTPALHEVICNHKDASPRECPYVPLIDPPWYGQKNK